MKRLTDRLSDGTAYVVSETGTEGVGAITTQRRLPELIARLARYEDSGLEPDEINCVNTNVYVNWRDDVFNDSGTEKLTIDSVGFMTHNGVFYAFNEIGKTVFLTSEDAEKALEVGK